MTTGRMSFARGLRDGIPICLGYLSVSFSFGILATGGGLPLWITELISLTNLTSAGQFAGTKLILAGGMYAEVVLATLIINLRYMLMSLSLSQKLPPEMPRWKRALLAFANTDEIFAVAMSRPETVTAPYFAGLATLPYLGWATGTLLGGIASSLLPPVLAAALNIALYGMFVALVVPPMKQSRPVAFTVLLSVGLSCLFRFTPVLCNLSAGWVIILCTVVSAAVAAWLFPVPAKGGEET